MDLKELYYRYREMLNIANEKQNEEWFDFENLPPGSSVTHERSKFIPIDLNKFNRFRDYYLGGIGLDNGHYNFNGKNCRFEFFKKIEFAGINVEAAFLSKIADKVRRSSALIENKKEATIWMDAIDDSLDLGGEKTFVTIFNRIKIVSPFSVDMAGRALRVSRVLGRNGITPSRIIELGGGYGKTLYDILNATGANTSYYIDLPMNIALTARFFLMVSPEQVNLVWSDLDNCQDGKINIIAPWLIEKLPNNIDLMINFYSLQHMQENVQKFYFDKIIKGRVSNLYHENRLAPRDSIEGALEHSDIINKGRVIESEFSKVNLLNRATSKTSIAGVAQQLINYL